MKKTILLIILWRLFLFIVVGIGSQFLSFEPRFPYAERLLIPSGLPNWLWSFANFDGVHYLTIAESGYSAQFTQVFFPLFPICVKVLAMLTGLSMLPAALVTVHLFFVLAMIIFYRMLQLDYPAHQCIWVILFLLCFPPAFFLGSVYTEGLFFLLIVATFVAARKKKWLLAGVLGGFSTATRFAGIFLIPALLVEAYQLKEMRTRQRIYHLFSLLLIPVGLLLYMAYLKVYYHDALYFWHAQPFFGAQRSGSTIVLPFQVLFRYIKILSSVPSSHYDFWVAVWELASFVLGIALLLLAHVKNVRLSYLVFSWFAVLVPSLTGTFSSMPRYILVAFPIFIVLGTSFNKAIKILWLLGSTVILVVFTLLFTRGFWVS